MGYLTRYSLSVDYMGTDKENMYEEIEKVKSAVIPNDYGTIGALIAEGMECKWYGHEKDMRKISKHFPKILFVLEGEGEENGDIWKMYFLDGKAQRCKAILRFPAFDATKLT